MNEIQQNNIKSAIAWAEEQRDWAAGRIHDFNRGEKLFRGTGNGPTEDVTEKHKRHFEQTVERMDKLIGAYKALLP